MAKNGCLKDETIAEALRATGGFISQAAKKLNVSQPNISARVKKSEYLQQELEAIKSAYLDLAEHALITKLRSGDLGAICFYLKCQGKQRGYIERQDVNVSGDMSVNVNIKRFTDAN